jgi:hypothetical protein
MVDAWATPQQVIDITGVTVTDGQLLQAQSSIEMLSNRIFDDTTRIRTRDLYWLRKAVAYQAAWIKGQYDLHTRLDATQVQQDGVVASLTDKAMLLGPEAKQALQRCSWMRSRTIHVRSPFVDGRHGYVDPLSDVADDQFDWMPVGGDT